MVYIHAGGFFSGSISGLLHGPQYFMDNGDVILVLMAYRLGALGFLSTGDEHSPGNFGLKDQTLALKWVKENIREFGGNANSITIFGASAGGASVHMHMMSVLSEGVYGA
jgi:juvenile-hormone esterase